MPYPRRFSAKMPDFDDDVTVVDVYDLASDIGKECEIIIEKYGPDAVTALLPKVINALELLENLAVRNEKENHALQELTAKISQLENDKIEKAEYRQRFEKEIEAIEEQWRTESADLVTAVARLQDENKRLRRTINAPGDGTSAPPSPAREHDQEVLSRLSSTAEKQRATLRHQELQLQEKQQLIEGLTNQVEKLAQVSRDLRRKHKQLQNQMRLVCEERSELTAIVQSQQRDITTLQQADAQNKKCAACGAGTPDGDDEDQSSRPTFSVRELRAILHERNELKLKLNRAEEQLQALQVEPQPDSSDTSPSLSSTAPEEEAPVQGPLPAEPDDAPWKRHSGIRKFFRKLFAESDIAVGSFPRRSLSSLGGRPPLPLPPRPPRTPRVPPPPRRHSHPTLTTTTTTQHHDHSKLDLRQEILNTKANQDFDRWLGDKYETQFEIYDRRFKHDVPLQRSISLDGGIAIINYLETVSSDWSERSIASSWTINSGSSPVIEQYSFEDIPASQWKSRRASSDIDNAFFGHNLALSVLRNSYKGIDVEKGGVNPQIRHLRRNFSVWSSDDPQDIKRSVKRRYDSGSQSELSGDMEYETEMEVRRPFYRSISQETSDKNHYEAANRRVGLSRNWSYQGIRKIDDDLRRKVLTKQNSFNFGSYDDIFDRDIKTLRRRSEELSLDTPAAVKLLKDSYKGMDAGSSNIRKLKRTFSFRSPNEGERAIPTVVLSNALSDSSVAKSLVHSNTSNMVDYSRICDCQICVEDEKKDRRSMLSRMLSNLFMKIVSCSSRKLTYWDENNNLSESEMYNSCIHLLKLMIGLWLRHFDHN